MAFTWRYENASGAEVEPVVPVEGEHAAYATQGDAETWIGENWPRTAGRRGRAGHAPGGRGRGVRPDVAPGVAACLIGTLGRRYGRFAGEVVSAGSRCTTGSRISSICLSSPASSFTPDGLDVLATCSGRDAPMIAAETFAVLQHPGHRELGHRQPGLARPAA